MTAAGMKQDTRHLTEVHGTSGSKGYFAVRPEEEGFHERLPSVRDKSSDKTS